MKILESSEKANQVSDAPGRMLPQQRPLLIVFAIMELRRYFKNFAVLDSMNAIKCSPPVFQIKD